MFGFLVVGGNIVNIDDAGTRQTDKNIVRAVDNEPVVFE
jgi:hypothetical protein